MIWSSAILAAFSAAFGFSLITAGTDSDNGISESRQAGPPGLAASGISSSSHCTYLRGFRPFILAVTAIERQPAVVERAYGVRPILDRVLEHLVQRHARRRLCVFCRRLCAAVDFLTSSKTDPRIR